MRRGAGACSSFLPLKISKCCTRLSPPCHFSSSLPHSLALCPASVSVGSKDTSYMLCTDAVHVCHHVISCVWCNCMYLYIVHDKQAKAKMYTQDSFLYFSKKKLPWVGFEPKVLCVLGERSTNLATRAAQLAEQVYKANQLT